MFSLLLLILTSQAHAIYPDDRLQIDTTSGRVQGIRDKATPDVAKFLGIPYAEAPTGSRRWLPPIPKKRQQGKIDATKFGPACAQWDYDPALQPNMNNQDVPELGIQPPDYWAEDCLSLSIWSPGRDNKPPEHAGPRLPVIVWVFGGGFSQGGANVPYQDPTPWVQRSKKHIVVSINHRVGLLGYPNAKGLPLTEQNLGLLDLRLALEWVQSNIAKFGGDAKRISLMGQSSGAMSADYYNYANPNDKIVSGYILHSGTAHIPFENLDSAQSNFTALAHHFNCTDSDPKSHVNCLRKVPAANLMAVLKKYADDMIQPGLTFVPIIDNRTVFTDADYTIRAHSGKLSRKPVLAGTTEAEGVSFVLPYNQTYGPPKVESDDIANWLLFCPLVETSRDRFVANTTTFRFLYAGNFSNVSPRPWQGAYHSSDLPMVFGTYDIVRGKGTEFQKKVSEKMQDLWVKFAEDPVHGLLKEGWKPYQNGTGEVVVFGKSGQVLSRTNETTLEVPCNGTKSGNNHHHMK